MKIYSSEISGSLKVRGDIFAENYVVKSTVSTITQSFSSGSTIFGDSNDDTHRFTGSLDISGSIGLKSDSRNNLFIGQNAGTGSGITTIITTTTTGVEQIGKVDCEKGGFDPRNVVKLAPTASAAAFSPPGEGGRLLDTLIFGEKQEKDNEKISKPSKSLRIQ